MKHNEQIITLADKLAFYAVNIVEQHNFHNKEERKTVFECTINEKCRIQIKFNVDMFDDIYAEITFVDTSSKIFKHPHISVNTMTVNKDDVKRTIFEILNRNKHLIIDKGEKNK